MGCVTSKKRNIDQYFLQHYADTINKISPEELNILKIIYFDLALRNGNKKIEKETFFVFFQKNGLWGHRLWKQFDLDNSDYVCLQQFIFSTAKIIKADEEAKINLLYEFFAFGNEDKQDGIIFSDFLRVLYNYSKDELKNMLQDSYQTDNKLKQELLNVLSDFERANPNDAKAKDQNICLQMQQNRLDSITASNVFKILLNLDKKKSQKNSFAGKPFQKEISSQGQKSDSINKNSNLADIKQVQTENDGDTQITKTKPANTIIRKPSEMQVHIGNKKITVKTGSYHALVKKVGGIIFNHFGINKKNGRLLKKQFIEWIKLNKNLYESYYKGFNQHIWQMKDGKFRYLSKIPEIQSPAKYVGYIFEAGELMQKSVMKNCMAFLQGSILFISDEQNKENLYNIIYLEGLEVAAIRQEKLGYGIEIRHKNNIYPKKNVFFNSQTLFKKWMEHLKQYKGFNLHEKYEMGLRIGAGKYSIVYQCKERENNKKYAIKQIDTFRLTTEEKSIISHQSNIMSLLDHPNLIEFKETIKTKNKIFIITELVEGKDLLQFVKQRDVLTEPDSAQIAHQIINGVSYMHRIGIIHRDLKPENIMISQKSESNEYQVKIIDFGFAQYIKNLQFLKEDDSIVGTPNFIAPEVYKKQKVTEKVDIFSIGTIIYFMLSGELPFNSDNLYFLIERTLTQKVSFVGKKWLKVSPEAKDLIEKLMQAQAQKRISLKQALAQSWFNVKRKIDEVEFESQHLNPRIESTSISSKKLYLF